MLTIKIHLELLFLLLLFLDDIYTNWSLIVCFTVLHIARHFSSCFTIGGRTSHRNKNVVLTTTITAPLFRLRCPPSCILFVKRFACMMSPLKRAANVVPHAEAEFVGLAVGAFGARAILTKEFVALEAVVYTSGIATCTSLTELTTC